MKHTPGPWEARGDGYQDWHFEGGYRGTIKNANGEEIYAGPACFHALRGRTPEEAEANARLIAAAPEMLDALNSLTSAYGTGNSGECWDKARQVIAKVGLRP